MIGAQFNGPVEQINYFPQLFSQNNIFGNPREWTNMETEWRNQLNAGVTVKVDIKPQFTGNSKRPDGFKVKQKYGNGAFTPRNDISNL